VVSRAGDTQGVDDRLGSLEPGKDADLVIWSGDPLDVLSRVERALIGGAEIYTAGANPEWAEPR
jgi:imidazolonepropionase-like amidohydrolase